MKVNRKKIATLAGIVLGVSMLLTTFPSGPAYAQSPIIPFGGVLLNADYTTCSCGFIIFTIFDTSKKVEYRVIHFYAAQVLELLADVVGLDVPAFLRLIVPRIFAFGAIWPGAGQVNVLGTFFPYQNAVCLQISSTGCSPVTPGANGYLYNMGTSLFPSQ